MAKRIVILGAGESGAGAVIVLARYYLYLTLQATERVKEYAIIVITERLISVAISIAWVLAGYRGYRMIVKIGRAHV